MAFNVQLYTFSKRDNSTKRPSGDGQVYSCVMKHGCGVLNPQITLDLGITGNPSGYNYARIPAFDRYYFIEEWYFEDALWTASLKVDVLATYKSDIGSSNLYVLRAAGESDGRIPDLLYPARTGAILTRRYDDNPLMSGISYIVGVVSKNGNKGSNAFYLMTGSDLQTMCANLMDADTIISEDYNFNDDFSKGLQLSLVDPLQYIKTCIAIPLSPSRISSGGHGIGSSERIYACNFDTGVSGNKLVNEPYTTLSFELPVVKHPDTNSRGNYVNSSPFTYITIVMPPFGCIDIDTTITSGLDESETPTVDLDLHIDLITGKGVLVVSCRGQILNRIESQIGVPISLSSVTRDYVGAATSALGAVGGAVGGFASGGVGGAFLGAASGIGNAVESLIPRAQTIGTTGGFGSMVGDIYINHQFFRPVADDNIHNGRPLCKMKTINTLSGYMLIQDGDVTINGTSTEDKQIRDYLEGGFYYE